MNDTYPPPPPLGDDQPPAPPPPAAPVPPAAPAAPGQWGAPPAAPPGGAPPVGPPAAPGQWGAPPPGQYGAPAQHGAPPQYNAPGQYGAPAAPGGFGAPGQQYGVPGQVPPGQIPAQPYQYGTGVPQQAFLAEPGKRIVARIIDWLIMAAVLIPLYIVLIGASASTGSSDAANGLFFGGFFAFILAATAGQVLYEVAFIAIKGQTPGKMIMKVKVVRERDGQIPGWGPAFLRWLPNLVGLVPCVGSFLSLGLSIWALVNLFSNPKRQTPFDLAAKTVVIAVG